MKVETTNLKTLIADEGKTFKRISDNEILGKKITFDTKFVNEYNFVEIDEIKETEVE